MKKTYNIYSYLLLRLLLALGVMILSQLSFYFCFSRIFYVENLAEWMGLLWGNIRFGLSTLTVVLAPYFFFNLLPFRYRWKKGVQKFFNIFLYIIPVSVLLVVNGIDSVYYQYTYHRLSGEVFCYLGVNAQMGSMIPHFFTQFWYAFAAFGVMFVLLLWGSLSIHLEQRSRYGNYNANDTIGMFVCFALLFLVARGGFQPHWLSPADAARYCQPKNTALVTNSVFTFYRSLPVTDHDYVEVDFSDNTSYGDVLFSMDFVSQACNDTMATVNDTMKKNVVLIVLESFSQEYMGCYNSDSSMMFTPFFDSLAQHSIVYQGRSNGKKSIEAITAIYAGIPTLAEVPFCLTRHCPDTIHALPWVLNRNGYHTSLFHGAFNGSMAFDDIASRMGFQSYFGMNEFNAMHCGSDADFDGLWGIYDEPFLQYMAHRVSKLPQPFFTSVYTISSHHPYKLPSNYHGEVRKVPHPLLNTITYTDNALRRFFETAKQEPWYNNTVFIITSDHSGQNIARQYNDYDGWYSIPMLVYDPMLDTHVVSPRIVQQIDIMPSIVDMLHLKESFKCMGSSVIQQHTIGWQVVYGSGYYMFSTNNPLHPEDHDITILSGQKRIGTPENIRLLQSMLYHYNNFYCGKK